MLLKLNFDFNDQNEMYQWFSSPSGTFTSSLHSVYFRQRNASGGWDFNNIFLYLDEEIINKFYGSIDECINYINSKKYVSCVIIDYPLTYINIENNYAEIHNVLFSTYV